MTTTQKIYINQGLVVKANAETDISTSTDRKINYIKPDGTTGSWTATIEGTTYLKYITDNDDLDQSGLWRFQIYCKIGGLNCYGETFEVNVYELGD